MEVKGKLKKMQGELPRYKVFIGEESDNAGLSLISIVANPAIKMMGIMLSEDGTIDYSKMEFKEVGEKMEIIGPVLIPDIRIPREDNTHGKHTIEFSKEDIAILVERFNKYGSNRKINLDHTNQMVDAFIVEDWIVEDLVFDKSRKYGFEVPVGTYMAKIKIQDKDIWENEVKGNKMYGFSMQGILGQKLISMSKVELSENEYNYDDLSIEDLMDIFNIKINK